MERVMLEDFREAINAKNWNLLRIIIQNNGDINLDNLLLEAIGNGSPSFVNILLELGANPNKDFGNPLFLAVKNNKPDVLRSLIKHGGNPNLIADPDGDSLLIHAVYEESIELVQILIEAGSNLKARNERGKHDDTALTIAASNGMIEIFNHLSQKSSPSDRKAAQKILLKVNQLEKQFFRAIETNDIETVQRLINNGIDVNRSCGNLGFPLLMAVHSNSNEIVKILIATSADPNIDDALIYAVSAYNPVMSNILLKAGADPNKIGSDGIFTPLIASIPQALAPRNPYINTYIFDKLLEFGAAVNQRNRFNNTAFMAGVCFCIENEIDYRNSKVIQALLDAGSIEENIDEMSLIVKAERGDIQGVKDMIAERANVNVTDFRGSTPLINAIRNLEIVRVLLEAGADVNMGSIFTPLMAAVNAVPFTGDKEIISYLLESGADISATNIYGKNVMNIIKEKEDVDVRKVLKSFFREVKKGLK
jgi:uncharacterized protein